MFNPLTENGHLCKGLIEMENKAQISSEYKYVENTGSTILIELGKVDPWTTHCNREECFSCKAETGK